MRWMLLTLLVACGAPTVCRDVYVAEDHGEQPYVLVRKCIVCRSATRLPTPECRAGMNLPLNATLEAPQ